MIIIVTGTPTSGKTTIAKEIAEKTGFKYLDPKPLIKEISTEYDEENQCDVVDTEKLNVKLIEEIRKGDDLIIDSHLSHYLPSEKVDICVVVTADLKVLRERMEKRGYSEKKKAENLEAEAFETCLEEAKQNGHKIIHIDNTESYESGLKEVLEILEK